MNYFYRLLAEGNQSDFLTKTLPILRIVLFFLIVACAIIITITIIMQSNSSDNSLDVVSGKQESYYAQNKGSSRDGKLKILTIIMACIIFICVILYFVTVLINTRG